MWSLIKFYLGNRKKKVRERVWKKVEHFCDIFDCDVWCDAMLWRERYVNKNVISFHFSSIEFDETERKWNINEILSSSSRAECWMGNVRIQTVHRRLSHYYYVEFIIVQRNERKDVEIISQKNLCSILSKELFSYFLSNHTLSKWASNFHFIFNIERTFEAPGSFFSLRSKAKFAYLKLFISFEHTLA